MRRAVRCMVVGVGVGVLCVTVVVDEQSLKVSHRLVD